MRTKTVLRKIAALGTGLAMMGATLAGAFAADLSAYPDLFLKDGKFNAAIVVGDQAAASDVVGSIDLAASLQFVAREEKTISLGGTTTISSVDGVEVSATGDHVTLKGDTLYGVENAFKDDDLPTLLADGTVRDDSTNEDYDYTQKLIPGADSVRFGLPNDDVFGDVPKIYLDQTSGEAYILEVEFDTTINITALDDSEKIVIAGKTFTFDPDVASTDSTLVLYASEKTETINVGDTKDVTLEDGTVLAMELVGANSDTESATLKVNTKTYSVTSGDTITPSGTSIYINDVFTYNIPTPGAAVEFFVGSDKVELTAGSGYNDVEVDDVSLTGVQAQIVDDNNMLEEVNYLRFKVIPSEFDDDEYKYLLMGEEFVDPFFGTFKMSFAGVTPELKSADRSKISLTRAGEDYKLAFTNKDGEDYEFALYTGGSSLTYHEDFAGATTNVTDDKIFILNEGDVAKVYELRSVTSENSVLYANLRDLSNNKDIKVRNNTEIGDTNVLITDLYNGATDWMELNDTTILDFKTEFDGNLTIGAPGTGNEITFLEGTTNLDDLANGDVASIAINVTEQDSDNHDITITGLTVTDTDEKDSANDDGNDVEYGVTLFGTYWERELDNAGDFVDIYYAEEETSFHVFFMPIGGTTSTSAGGDTLTYFEYNKIEVGAAKLASEIADPTAQNLIVVGGPCANSVASALKNNPANCAEGFEDGKAIVELIESGNNVAVLVAGYSAADTRRATTVLANFGSYALTGKQVEVTGTNMQDITVTVPVVE